MRGTRATTYPVSRRGLVIVSKTEPAEARADHVSAASANGFLRETEFLGDRVLGLGVAHMLIGAFGQESEGCCPPSRARAQGDLRRSRAALGGRPFIRLGEGEAQSAA